MDVNSGKCPSVKVAPPTPPHPHTYPPAHVSIYRSLAEGSLGAEQPARAGEGTEKIKGMCALGELAVWPPPVPCAGDL